MILVYPSRAALAVQDLFLHVGVGEVESNGAGATRFKPGQRVVAAPWPTVPGIRTWQQYIVVAESDLIAVPDSVSDDAAVQFFVNPVTVYGLLEVRCATILP